MCFLQKSSRQRSSPLVILYPGTLWLAQNVILCNTLSQRKMMAKLVEAWDTWNFLYVWKTNPVKSWVGNSDTLKLQSYTRLVQPWNLYSQTQWDFEIVIMLSLLATLESLFTNTKTLPGQNIILHKHNYLLVNQEKKQLKVSMLTHPPWAINFPIECMYAYSYVWKQKQRSRTFDLPFHTYLEMLEKMKKLFPRHCIFKQCTLQRTLNNKPISEY